MTKDTSIVAAHKDWLVCHDCGTLQTTLPISKELEMVCSHCGNVLHVGRGQWLDKATALAVTALVLFLCSNVFTFLTLRVAGYQQDVTILSGVGALLDRQEWILAAVVFVTTFLLPLFEILVLLYLLLPYKLRIPAKGQIRAFRWLETSQAWIMLDVFLLGVLVTTVKLGDQAAVDIGPGMVFFFALVAALRMAYWLIDKKNLWSWLYLSNYFTQHAGEALYDCGVCNAMVGESIVQEQACCPRCHSAAYTRIPHSLQKTTALVIAAIILYIPANIYPIMTYDELAITYESTIFSGVVELAGNGLWVVAIVVFVASMVVPIIKLMTLTYLVWSVQKRHVRWPKERVMLHRVTEFIGRWSMVDVFVVTLLTAVVQFGFIGSVDPGPALLPFAAVVVLTMLAAQTFDARLIWDNADAAPIQQSPFGLADVEKNEL